MATPIGFEPTISTLTGWRVRPGYTTGPREPGDDSTALSGTLSGYAGSMPTSRRPSEVSAGGVVVRSGDTGWEVCLIRVGQRWSLPKGNLDRGETPQQAALREVSEETGLPLDRLRVRSDLAPAEYAYRRGGRLIFKLVHHFLIEAPPDAPLRPQAGEVEEVRWLPFEEALKRVSYRDLVHPLEDARRLLGGAPR